MYIAEFTSVWSHLSLMITTAQSTLLTLGY